MMQEEYEEMVGHEVDGETYAWIEEVYMNHPRFGCPDDVRQFVKKKGGEDQMLALAMMAKGVWHDRYECMEAYENYRRQAADAKSVAAEAVRHRENDERTIVDLTRRAREAENQAAEAVAERDSAVAELKELRRKLAVIQDALAGLEVA